MQFSNHKPHTCSYTFHSQYTKMFGGGGGGGGGKLKGWEGGGGGGEGSFLLIDVTLNSCTWE